MVVVVNTTGSWSFELNYSNLDQIKFFVFIVSNKIVLAHPLALKCVAAE